MQSYVIISLVIVNRQHDNIGNTSNNRPDAILIDQLYIVSWYALHSICLDSCAVLDKVMW